MEVSRLERREGHEPHPLPGHRYPPRYRRRFADRPRSNLPPTAGMAAGGAGQRWPAVRDQFDPEGSGQLAGVG